MSLACFKCWRRNRKQAVEEPAPHVHPQATTQDINLGGFSTNLQCHGAEIEGSDIDDTAIVPATGFLHGNNSLPTYRPKNVMPHFFSPGNWVVLTISDVLSTMRKESYLARCVLFETARLQRPLLSLGPLKLSQNARVVDMQLLELNKVLKQGDELIHGSWKEEDQETQDLILKGEPFQKALRTAKKSLLELEKTFNDQILSELKNGMQSKEGVDYDQIVGKVRNLNNELQQVYNKPRRHHGRILDNETETTLWAIWPVDHFPCRPGDIGDVVFQNVVKRYLEDCDYFLPLYMITGLKIPKGVSVNLEDGTKVDVKVGATLPDALADVKPIMQIIRNRTDSISFNSKTDFILAFRVRKIITVNGKIQHKLSMKGTSMLDGDEEEVKRVGKDTLGDDYSSEEARKEAEEEEFDVMIFKDQADNDGDEFDWIVADVAA